MFIILLPARSVAYPQQVAGTLALPGGLIIRIVKCAVLQREQPQPMQAPSFS